MTCLKRILFAADQLRVKTGRTMLGACGRKGHSKFWQKGGHVKAGQNNCSPWFCPFCRAKALCGKEAFPLQAFWLLLWRQK